MLYFGQNAIRYLLTLLQPVLNGKVSSIPGKGLSSNDYTDADRAKIARFTEAEAGCLSGAKSNLQEQIDRLAQGTPVQTAGSGIRVAAMSDHVAAKMQVPTPSGLQEGFQAIDVGVVAARSFTDVLGVGTVELKNTIDISDAGEIQYSKLYVDTSDGYRLQTHYTFLSAERPIDLGKMQVLDIDLAQFDKVEGIEVV